MHLADIFQAYFDCCRRKRRTQEALFWEEYFEANCLQLYQEIISGKYQPDPYKLIYASDPVMREIFVPTFRDRVVHHLLANWLRPKLESLFIYDNYAGREGKGTLFGIRRAEKFMRQVTHNYQKPAYVLKLDIASYFRNIPKERLWEKIEGLCCSSFSGLTRESRSSNHSNFWRPSGTFDSKSTRRSEQTSLRVDFKIMDCGEQINSLSNSATKHQISGCSNSICSQTLISESAGTLNQRERERELIDLLKRVIFHDPRTHFSGKIDAHFPHHKSFFSAPGERGLPLGDLVSQLLGNFYLHELDHFVKHSLRIKQYGRYMDDMIFFHSDKEVLEDIIVKVRMFLRDTLGLTLHEGKIVLNTCEHGILFLGAYIKPWRTYISNRTKKNMFADIYSGILPSQATYQSYLGLTGHFDTYRLQKMYRDTVIVLGLQE